jgi:ribA/ribD-fused uncharacterized protein
MKETATHIYFFSDKDYMSNFYYSDFVVNNTKYICNEQYIMAQKALLFNDNDAFNQIMQCTKPYNMKQAGRKVKNFSDSIWLQHRNKILQDGLYAKFSQNANLRNKLLNTGNKTLVEASPYDKIYGVGLGENDEKILDENNWKGQNLLGYTLMNVRNLIAN